MEDKLKNRNKLIRIAGSSEGGLETVRHYEASPLADDSEDECRLKRAESRAVHSDRSQTATRHVTHLTLVTLLLVLVTHGSPHREQFASRIIPVEASELSQQEVHFQEPASPVDHSVISGRPVRTSLESSLPEAQLQSEGTGTAKSELDLEDKYNIASFDNDLILTNDYYEYEQGQKEIIVKRRLKNNIHFLEDCSKSKQFCH